ncbi:GNAT family N-acetyltransferase [Paractinoplanes lichenicola]|uniref:GNAT family N-acetyltransferase n=1 Tax=Paractinoplanes lichenicola TaxID=2802976 RepID=A0ABS1VXZ6_9ACTN|nr:GNAT family N-acetyltransferase [Actinoplanes lichenicola]MBL7259288.1 GNAT family N-acetyltransferase [Actinoplanes lichenicola]
MPLLVPPTVTLHKSWLAARDEWPPGAHMDGHGVRETDDVDSEPGFAAWVADLHAQADETIPPAADWVHCTYRWIVEDDDYLGSISLRHTLNDMLLEVGGHIGYGIRPSARRRGLASWALGETLQAARALGLDRVLITCNPTNVASARVIESHGGAYEDTRTTGAFTVKRYWITLA